MLNTAANLSSSVVMCMYLFNVCSGFSHFGSLPILKSEVMKEVPD